VLGVVGLGRIGRSLAAKAGALGFALLGHDPLQPDAELRRLGVEPCDLATLLGRADAVSLHAPLTPATRHLIGRRELGLMKPSALLVNASRGGLVDGAALLEALERGRLSGAALDVLEREPPDPDEPLLRLENVIVTPHAGFYSRESLEAVQVEAAEAVAAVLGGGRPRVVANPAVLEHRP
jgi:D-3-phosphoglycerate dehydrogenase